MSGDGDLFSTPMQGGVQAFFVRNLDTGEAVHVAKAKELVDSTGLMTFDVLPPQPEPASKKPAYCVAVTGSDSMEEADGTGKTFTMYTIQVTHAPADGRSTEWVVRRRYTDFLELDKLVKASPVGDSVRAPLPPKKWLLSKSESVVRERRAAFGAYLTDCLQVAQPLHHCPPLASFLETRLHTSSVGRPASPSALFEVPQAADMEDMVSLAEAAETWGEYK